MKLAIQVEHLAPPGKVADGATTYVAWAKPTTEKGQPQNLGAIYVKDRKGELDAKMPAQDLTVTLTPEKNPSVQAPTHEPVLWASVSPSE